MIRKCKNTVGTGEPTLLRDKGRLDSAQKWPKETTADFNHAIVMSAKATSKLSPQLVVGALLGSNWL